MSIRLLPEGKSVVFGETGRRVIGRTITVFRRAVALKQPRWTGRQQDEWIAHVSSRFALPA